METRSDEEKRIMIKQLDIWNPKDDGHDMALYIACNEFEKRHPKETQPDWLKYCLSIKINRNRNGNWVVSQMVLPKAILDENQYVKWEDDGVPILVQIDPVTQKESIIISGGPPQEFVVIFEVEVDFAMKQANVLIDSELDKMDGKRYEMNIRYL